MFIKSLLPFLAFGQRDDEDDGVQLGCSRVLRKTFCDFLKIDSNPVSSPDFKNLTNNSRKITVMAVSTLGQVCCLQFYVYFNFGWCS